MKTIILMTLLAAGKGGNHPPRCIEDPKRLWCVNVCDAKGVCHQRCERDHCNHPL